MITKKISFRYEFIMIDYTTLSDQDEKESNTKELSMQRPRIDDKERDKAEA